MLTVTSMWQIQVLLFGTFWNFFFFFFNIFDPWLVEFMDVEFVDTEGQLCSVKGFSAQQYKIHNQQRKKNGWPGVTD